MKRIRAGWQLTKKSWSVLQDSPGLVRFPLFGGAIALLLAIILIGPGLYLIEDSSTVAGAILVAVGTYLCAFVTFYFVVGVQFSLRVVAGIALIGLIIAIRGVRVPKSAEPA